MRDKILRALLLLAVFFGGVLFFSRFMNTEATETASDLTDATLPVLYANLDGVRFNRMFGYTQAMEARDMREGIIPISTDRAVSVTLRDNGNKIRSIAYEVTTPDTGEVLENAKIADVKEETGELRTANFSLNEPILMNREYPIRFTVTTGTGEVYFYARLLQRGDLLTKDYINFVNDFTETCFNKAAAEELATYLETDETANSNSYANIDIHASVDQITWGNLSPNMYRRGVPTICEINPVTCSLTNAYSISAEHEGQTEYYRVEEFYRLRYFNGRMRLLDFSRKTRQSFDGAEGAITSDGIFLGLTDRNVQYLANADGRTVAFVQDHALWEYKEASARLMKVFSFEDFSANGDERDENTNYGIKIIRVSEGGDIDFLVYGQMVRGEREGQSGIMLCHYYGEATTVQETAFLAYPKSYVYLAQDLEKLCYINQRGEGYFYLDRKIVHVLPQEKKVEIVLADIHPDGIVASLAQNQIAWTADMQVNACGELIVMDLETGSQRSIRAESGEFLRPLGFIYDDFLFGAAREADIVTYPAGNLLFPMHALHIEDQSGARVKTYEQENYFVTGVEIKEGLVELVRLQKTDKGYLPAGQDNIANNRNETASEVHVEGTSTKRQGLCVTIAMPNQGRSLHPKVESFRVKKISGKPLAEASLAHDTEMPLYYVYTAGHLSAVCADPAKAVQDADAGVGTVVNNEGQYIYERGNLLSEYEIENRDIPEEVLSGEVDAAKLQEALGDKATVMNLSGCTLDQMLYELSLGRPVITCAADGSTVVIVGFNEHNTRLYNFADGTHYYFGINDSRAAFEAGGNVFVSIAEPQATIKNKEEAAS